MTTNPNMISAIEAVKEGSAITEAARRNGVSITGLRHHFKKGKKTRTVKRTPKKALKATDKTLKAAVKTAFSDHSLHTLKEENAQLRTILGHVMVRQMLLECRS